MKQKFTQLALKGLYGDGDGDGASEGVLVVDLELKPVALDQGAEAILKGQLAGNDGAAALPPDMRQLLGGWPRSGATPTKTFLIGTREYRCRVFVVEPREGGIGRTLLAVHLKREASVNEAVSRIAGDYGLTRREQEALAGVAVGLTSKELAAQMNISPNTVNTFLRLITVKMSVTTRAGIVARLLEQNGGPSDADSSFQPRGALHV